MKFLKVDDAQNTKDKKKNVQTFPIWLVCENVDECAKECLAIYRYTKFIYYGKKGTSKNVCYTVTVLRVGNVIFSVILVIIYIDYKILVCQS